jgi:hypothetical protein
LSRVLSVDPSARRFVRIRASGLLRAEDYQRFEPAFAAELERRTPPVPLVLDMRGFRGWTPRGFLRDLAWDLGNRRTFSRIAVIGEAPWHRLITAAGRPLFRAPMKFFRPDQASEAEDWLAGPS